MTRQLGLSAFKLRGRLLLEIPSDRFRLTREHGNPPTKGDIVGLDQGFTEEDGEAMTLVYGFDVDGNCDYEAELYDSDFEFIKAD